MMIEAMTKWCDLHQQAVCLVTGGSALFIATGIMFPRLRMLIRLGIGALVLSVLALVVFVAFSSVGSNQLKAGVGVIFLFIFMMTIIDDLDNPRFNPRSWYNDRYYDRW